MAESTGQAASEAIPGPGQATPTAVPLDAARQRQPPSTATIDISGGGLTRPMYIPAILQHTGIKNKHLQGVLGVRKKGGDEGGSRKGSTSAGGPGGKRKRRRWENAQLAGNPHLHRPTRADFAPGPYMKGLTTTFSPPPASFSRSTYISSSPASSPSAAALAASSDSGMFAMSLRGLRKNLRTALGARRGEGGRTEEVLEIMERELVAWLTLSGRIPEGFYHDSTTLAPGGVYRGKLLDPTPLDDLPFLASDALSLPDLPTSSSDPSSAPAPPTLTELSRQPHTLVWLAPSPHHRFLLHSLARYYSLQSFSRPLSPLEPELRVTHILRPQLVLPRPTGLGTALGASLETPPGTDWSSAAGGTTTEGELTATDTEAYETDTDVGSVAGDAVQGVRRWDAESVTSAPSVRGADTDEEAEAFYSTESDSAPGEASAGEGGEDSEYEREGGSDGGVDSLASSFADLSAVPAPASRLATPSRPSTAPFLPFSPVSSATPIPSFRLSSPSGTPAVGGDATPTRPSRTAERTRGRRSLPGPSAGGYDSPAESSPSRSRDREAPALRAFRGVSASQWRMPEKGILEWIIQ
ncbi:hypothetical protein JCM10213_003912 [Rhodosporidiobolus nylandii]